MLEAAEERMRQSWNRLFKTPAAVIEMDKRLSDRDELRTKWTP
jgi:hypothetical protein